MAISRLVRLWIALALLLGDQSIAVDVDNHVDTSSLLLKESIVKYVNSNPESGWKAAMNTRFLNYTVSEFKRMLGVRPTPDRLVRGIPILTHSPVELPEEFDARETWPNCSTIGRILDQGHCGSCWAFGAVESLSDRFCIRFGINVSLSVNDLLSCCHDCGDGCEGGYPISAWKYFTDSGVVTEKCEPYFDEKGCSHPGCEPVYPTPKCDETCSGGTEIETWVELKHYALSAYRISSDPQSIMEEIRRNGPVEVSFSVYEDFAHYKSGVYKHVAGRMLGGHAVKLMGWGTTEEGEEYWMLANQWNRSWGDDGFFKMKRGSNECGVESNVVGGAPSPRNLITGVADITLHHPYHFLSAAH